MNQSSHIQDGHPLDVEFQIKRWIPIVLVLLAAVYAGYCVGMEDWKPLIICGGVAMICFVASTLQDRGWILIPLFWLATGSISSLSVPLSYRDFGILLALCAYVVHRCMVRTRPIPMGHLLFLLILLNVAWMGVTWIRKPVGFRVFESEMMGARFYFNNGMALIAIWVLIRLPNTDNTIHRIPFYMIAGTSLGCFAALIAFLIPSTAFHILKFYSDAQVFFDSSVEVQRFFVFREMGTIAVLIAATHSKRNSLFNPFHPHFWILILGLTGVAIAGYRSAIAICLAYVGLSMILRRNWRQMILSSTIAACLLGVLTFGQGRFYSLPLPIQRSLSFLPGDWSPVAMRDASSTTDVRFDWWRNIIKYRLITNWWLGDGIGVRTSEINVVNENSRKNFDESIFFYGTFHNGPLTTIRCVGIIGLLFLYALMIAPIIYAIRCVKRCRDTRWESFSLFLAIPIIWLPIHFTFLTGSFETDLPQVIFQTGLLLLLIRMMNEHPEVLSPHPADS